MKNFMLIPLACFFACFSLFSQPNNALIYKHNAYRSGDQLIKQQVNYTDPGSSGQNLRWDFRHLTPVEPEYSLRYFIPDSSRMEHICGMEHNTRYYYLQKEDSLFTTGYENTTTLMTYTTPELRMKYPFNYGDTLYSQFQGKGEYGRRLKLTVAGITHIKADAEGELLLPGNETIQKALRIHTSRHYTHYTPQATTGEAGVSPGMTVDTYSWYARGSRYPVFESIKTTVLRTGKNTDTNTEPRDTTIFTTSFYYPPVEQDIQLDSTPKEEPECTDPKEPDADIFTQATLLPNPVTDILTIQYKLTREADITFSLHNNSGIALLSVPQQRRPEGYHQTPINMSHLISGTYTLYVKVDEKIIQLNVVKL